MTAQHDESKPMTTTAATGTTADKTDPLGPITLPKPSKVGARALALVGTVGMSTVAIAAISNNVASTWPTI